MMPHPPPPLPVRRPRPPFVVPSSDEEEADADDNQHNRPNDQPEQDQPEDDPQEEPSGADVRRQQSPEAFTPLPPEPVQLPEPDWDAIGQIIPLSAGLINTFKQGIHVAASSPYCRVKKPAAFDYQDEALDAYIQEYVRCGLLEQTSRPHHFTYAFLIPKDKTKLRFIANFKRMSRHVPPLSPTLPSVFQILSSVPTGRKWYAKLDLKNAFWHFRIRPRSRRLLTIRHRNAYYMFNRLPFGLNISPYFCNALAAAIAQEFRNRGSWAWAHIDDIVICNSSYEDLAKAVTDITDRLTVAGIHINTDKSILQPQRSIIALGARWTQRHVHLTKARQEKIHESFSILGSSTAPLSWKAAATGLLAYVWPFLPHAPYALLRPMYKNITDKTTPLLDLWNKHNRPIAFGQTGRPPDKQIIAADATPTTMAIVTGTWTASARTASPKPITFMELMAAAWAAVNAPQGATILTDNLAVFWSLTRYRSFFIHFDFYIGLYKLIVEKHLHFLYVPSEINPADQPSRLALLSHMRHDVIT